MNSHIKHKLNLMNFLNMNDDPSSAIKSIVDMVTVHIWPLMIDIKHKLSESCCKSEENNNKLIEVFTLCASQIKKCVLHLLEIFKLELQHSAILKESRTCLLERLSWCVDKLEVILKYLDNKSAEYNAVNVSTDSLFVTPMYFVNWIDNTFELLSNLSNIVYKFDADDSPKNILWKNELIDCLTSLHISVDELLLSALTLSKYCLAADQHVVTARCQVVLRETKALITEIVKEDLNSACKFTAESLKLPLMPSNINVLIDVLKDVLYVLETNTNSALLSLLVHCFSFLKNPVTKLKEHFENDIKESCGCDRNNKDNVDDCLFVKEFDLYNERLLQIGFFAVSCSTDQKRIVRVRSGLASLEALEPHLVPALALRTLEPHARALTNTWQQELAEIRDNVFLIVDPAAFVDKCKQMIHKQLLEVIRNNTFDSEFVENIIGMASVVHEFFAVYNKLEPEALNQGAHLVTLLKDLNKAQRECKTVNEMFNNNKTNGNNITATTEKLVKRLKLLYTLINRINNLFNKDENDEIFGDNKIVNNTTKNNLTFAKEVPKSNKNTNKALSRSVFARGVDTTRNVSKPNVLTRLTKHLNLKQTEELDFSVQLDKLFDMDNESNLNLTGIKDNTVLYNFSPMKSRKSLRKAVLNRNYKKPIDDKQFLSFSDKTFNKSDAMDATTTLQITEILDQLEDMSIPVSTTKQTVMNLTNTIIQKDRQRHVVSLSINENTSTCKRIWNIPVHSDVSDGSSDVTRSSLTSNVTTLERINDLNLLENRLNDLKLMQRETTL